MESYIKENYVKDKVIIVTGASSGFGYETAKQAAALGGKVVLAARREEKLKENVAEIRALGGDAIYVKTDVRCRDQVEALVKTTIDTYGRVDVLVNDAGTMPQAFFSDHIMAMDGWEECIDTCIKGTLYGMCAVYDPMMAQGQGQIINVSSIMANLPVSGAGVYNACKIAVKFLADAYRVEARGHIKVSTIKPTGVQETDLQKTVINLEASSSGLYGKMFDVMVKSMAPDPAYADLNSIKCDHPTPAVIAENIVYMINQPWGVNIGDITVRGSGENLYV